MRFCEQYKIVPVFADADLSDGVTGDSICMKNYHSACFVFLSTTTDWTAGPDVILNSGATDGAETTAMTVNYRSGSAAVGSATSDVLGVWASSAEVALGADEEGYMYVFEVEASEMTDGHDWLTISLDSDASAGIATCVAILKPRYAQNLIPTALA